MIKQFFLIILFFGFLIGISGSVYATNWDYSARCVGETPYQCHNGLSVCWECTPGKNYCRHSSSGTQYCTMCPDDCKPACVPTWGAWSACSESCGGGTQSRTKSCTGATDSQNCNTQVCAGSCGSATGGVYTYPVNSFATGVNFCSPVVATPNPNPVLFPVLTGNSPLTTSSDWTCHTINGTDGNTCSVTLEPPAVSCGPQNSGGEINTVPIDPGLCEGDYNSPTVILNADGEWEWNCVHSDFSGIREDGCTRQSCISGDLIKYNSDVYLMENLNDQTTNVSIFCNNSTSPKICCDIDSTDSINGLVTTHVCTGDTDKEIFVASGTNENYPARCYFVPLTDPTCETDIPPTCPGPVITKILTISTMCSQKECNAQGTCQSTPMTASNLNQCSSTCNSNADCSSGRMIETQP